MRIEFVNEFKLGSALKEQIRKLLFICFKDDAYKSRIYYKQRAHSRLLLFEGDELVGQLGLDYRVMKLGIEPIQVLGIIDFTIAPSKQGKGYGTLLLEEVDKIAREYNENIDFVLLAADKHNVYLKNGYKLVKPLIKWLGIDEHKTLRIIERTESDIILIKKIGNKEWDDSLPLDMLGYMY